MPGKASSATPYSQPSKVRHEIQMRTQRGCCCSPDIVWILSGLVSLASESLLSIQRWLYCFLQHGGLAVPLIGLSCYFKSYQFLLLIFPLFVCGFELVSTLPTEPHSHLWITKVCKQVEGQTQALSPAWSRLYTGERTNFLLLLISVCIHWAQANPKEG